MFLQIAAFRSYPMLIPTFVLSRATSHEMDLVQLLVDEVLWGFIATL